MTIEILGVDIGDVIMRRERGMCEDLVLTENYLRAPMVPDAFFALRKLVTHRFGAKVYLIAKSQLKSQTKVRHWLLHHGFHNITGISPDQVYFCLDPFEKNGLCQKLGVTHFIDDRLDVLLSLTSVRYLYLFEPSPEDIDVVENQNLDIYFINSWQAIDSWRAILPLTDV